MDNKLKVYKSDRFDVEDAASLSLFLYPDSLYIFAKDKNQANLGIHAYSEFEADQISKLIVSDPLLRFDIPTKVYLHQLNFSLVPGMLFSPGKEASYLSYVGPLNGNKSYFSTSLDSNNLVIVSSLPEKVKKELQARFSELSFHHGATSFLSYLFKERFNLIGQEILIYVFENHIYLAAFTDQELSIFNMFDIDSKDDILKYSLSTIKQLKYDRNYVRISVFGATDKSGITEEWGKKYFQHFRLLTPHANQNYTHGFKHLKSINLFETNWQFD